MAFTQFSDVLNPQVLAVMINSSLPAQFKFTPYASIDTTLTATKGDTITVPQWTYSGPATDGDELTPIVPDKFGYEETTYTVKEAVKGVEYTEKADIFGYGGVAEKAARDIAIAFADKMNSDVLATTADAQLSFYDTAPISYAGIVNGLDVFYSESWGDGYVMFIHPHQATQLRLDPDFLSADKYQAGVAVTGEIGRIAGVRVVISRLVRAEQVTPSMPVWVRAKSSTPSAQQVTATGTGNPYDLDKVQVWIPNAKENDYVVMTGSTSGLVYDNPIIKMGGNDLSLFPSEIVAPANTLPPPLSDLGYNDGSPAALTIHLKKSVNVTVPQFNYDGARMHRIFGNTYYGANLTNLGKVARFFFPAN